MDDLTKRLILALQEIARGRRCKGPLPAKAAQAIAKAALVCEDLDWSVSSPFAIKPNSEAGKSMFAARANRFRDDPCSTP